MARDPLDALELAADVVARRIERAQARQAYEVGNRLGLLWVHGLVGVTAGLQMVLYGTAQQVEQAFGPESRYPLGAAALLGGLLLLTGLLHRPRSIPMEAVGLGFLALWDVAMTGTLAWARWHQHNFRLLGPHEVQPHQYVPGYPVTVYGGLLALLVIHLWTLRLLRRARRTEDEDGEPAHAREP